MSNITITQQTKSFYSAFSLQIKMCFNFKFFKNKKTKGKERIQYEHIQVQLVNLLNENRALHICLTKLHLDLQGQLNDLKEISLNGGSIYNGSHFETPTIHRKNQSTMKVKYI